MDVVTGPQAGRRALRPTVLRHAPSQRHPVRFAWAASILVGAAPLAAQAAAPGWLGIRLEQRYECVWETQEDWKACDLVLSVRELEEDGPAWAGGVEVGDQIVAIDGENITLQNWTTFVSSFRPGRPLGMDVLRGGERRSARVVPAPRPADPEAAAWVGGSAVAVAPSAEPRVFVLMLTEPTGSDRAAVALTVRDTEELGVSIEPSAVRVIDGRLRVLPLRDRAFPELPELRRELLGELAAVTESTYLSATSAFEVLDRVRGRLSSSEFQRDLARIAQVGLEEAALAVRFGRAFAGAELEPVRRYGGRAGLLVLSVVPGTAAARLGLRPGDLVVRAGDDETREIQDLIDATWGGAGDPVRVYWVREGREMSQRWPGQ